FNIFNIFKNMKTKTLYLAVALGMMLGFSSCDLNYFPSDELNSNALLGDPAGAQYIVDGCYAMLKEEYEYIEYASSNTYVRHYMQMAEFPADNTCLSGRTTDPLYQATCYKMTDNLKNVGLFWWVGYKVIFTANTVIEGFEEGKTIECDQLLGEAYFLRAMCHFQMATIFAKPYSHGRENPGIVLRTSTNTAETTRATVGEVYDQVVRDLNKAANLMSKSRGNAGYASKNAALGLLSRVYLYEEKNDSVIAVVNQMGAPALDPDYEHYFAKALTSKETLFCVAHTSLEDRGQASIGSMFNGDGGGWGEVYCSDPLLNLYERYPEDVRLTYIKPQYYEKDTLEKVYFAVPDSIGSSIELEGVLRTDGSDLYCAIIERVDTIKSGGKEKYDTVFSATLPLQEELVNGEYPQKYVTYEGKNYPVRIAKTMIKRNSFPNYFVTKFGYQDGKPQLSSPVFLRWAEVILNRAEAYAKLGRNAEALADVDMIRQRAGIPAEGMFSSNMHGYTDVLDIVLDERRMELAFEGHRMFDVYRNKRDMDRRFGGVHPWEIVKWDDNKIQYPIPYGEWSVSHIDQNPGY
ncbi:MAG: RagB/SusD family nutrient uptake outer membrane protein, partial [Paludibacteraceae bacterium]|nr:RagB/SusD family nutrient uptake outer membrane protein [Paludibacteraceae bacterium]